MFTAHPKPTRLLLFRHGCTLLRGRVLRWRLETYGVYMPSLPNARPWWRPNFHALSALLRRRRVYGEWLREMDAVRRDGPSGWWRERLGAGFGALQAYIQHENRADGPYDNQGGF